MTIPRWMAWGVAAVTLATLIVAQETRPADYKHARFTEVSALIPKLEELAAWCHAATLFRERDRLNALIVVFDGDHAGARAALQYRRQPDKTWARSAQWHEARNSSEKSMPEYTKRRADLVDPVAMRLLDALDLERTSMDPAVRDRWLEELVEAAPDNVRVRDAIGEKRLGTKWVLAETASAAGRRAELLAFASLDKDSPKTIETAKPNEFESKLALKWTAVRQTKYVRVVSTVPPSTVDKAVRHFDAAWVLTHHVFGVEPDPGTQATVILLKTGEEVRAYLATHPETPDADRGAVLAGYTLSASNVAVVGHEIESDRLIAGRTRITHLGLAWAVPSDTRPAWALEGLSGYVSFLLGAGLSPFFGEINPGGPLGQRVTQALGKPGANWLEVAAGIVGEGKAPKLSSLMSVGLFKMTPVDSLFSAALVAYFAEGRPADAGAVVRAASRAGMTPEVAVRETLAIELPVLEKRFHRWIQESSTLPAKR